MGQARGPDRSWMQGRSCVGVRGRSPVNGRLEKVELRSRMIAATRPRWGLTRAGTDFRSAFIQKGCVLFTLVSRFRTKPSAVGPLGMGSAAWSNVNSRARFGTHFPDPNHERCDMPIRNLNHLFSPKTVAIVGASQRPGSVGNIVAQNLVRSGYAGRMFAVNRHYEDVEGVACFPSMDELPERIDLAILCTPAESTPKLIDQCGRNSAKSVVVLA